VLVVVKHRNVQFLAQARLDLEAARRRDVLQVDPSKSRSDRANSRHDLVDVLRGQADRKRVDTAELLEQHGLAFHYR